jgi:uncharacterized protein YqhQ
LPRPPFFYGGQAVIEGVMIRGQRFFSLAVRRSNGSIYHSAEPLSTLYTGPVRRLPFLRGIIVLVETLGLGYKALSRSANIALEDQSNGEVKEMSGVVMTATMLIALAFAIGLFFLLPLFAARSLDGVLDDWLGAGGGADFMSNLIEGLIRLGLLVGYIVLIGMMKDIRRVFAYHGAEHMTIHAYEHNLPLEVEHVRPFPTAHPRCGTAFLLTVAVVAVLVFALLGRPDLHWAILSRIVLVPVIAAISYEFLRFSGAHSGSKFGQIMAGPGLLLQRLTTRRPDDQQIEVAIHAMKSALAADKGEAWPSSGPVAAGETPAAEAVAETKTDEASATEQGKPLT